MVTIRGRRQVGKTWLVEEFIERVGAPRLFFAASHQTEERELALFAVALSASSLPSATIAAGTTFGTWQAALVNAASGSDPANPSIIVLDEFPYLLGSTEQSRRAVLGAIQSAWDRTLSKQPVLLVLVGSDQAMMEMITAPQQPLYQRPSREIHVPPLSPVEAAQLSGLTGADALDSYLVTGGFPKVVRAKMGRTLRTFLLEQLADDGTPLVTTGRQLLDSELVGATQARTILSVIGEGFRKRTDIAGEVGVDAHNLKPPLDFLVDQKRVIEGRRPLSTATSRDTRYEIVDPYLRFFTRFIDRNRGEIERGLGRVVAETVLRDWSIYRGKAIEALVREAIEALLPDSRLPRTSAVGAFWTPDNAVEVDLVGADRRQPPTTRITFVGSVKWRENKLLDRHDYEALVTAATRIPGAGSETPTIGVSRSGADTDAITMFDVVLGPEELLAAWA